MKIAVFTAENPWGIEIDEDSPSKGLGGRETALVELAKEWARQGHEVFAFVPRESTKKWRPNPFMDGKDLLSGSLTWINNQITIETCEIFQPDIFVSWENLEVLKMLKDSSCTALRLIEMQVAHLQGENISDYVDYACTLSGWAKEFFLTQHPDMEGKVLVFANGIDPERFTAPFAAITQTRSINFVYSSSPDRGLHHLLDMWPLIQQRLLNHFKDHEINLHICYGIENFVENSKWAHRESAERALTIQEKIGLPGVIYHGKIGQDELARLMRTCDAMLYPCDPMSPTETGCISIVEAMAAGCHVFTTDADCLGESYGKLTNQVSIFKEGWKSRYITMIENGLTDYENNNSILAVAYSFATNIRSWESIATNWINDMDGLIEEKKS